MFSNKDFKEPHRLFPSNPQLVLAAGNKATPPDLDGHVVGLRSSTGEHHLSGISSNQICHLLCVCVCGEKKNFITSSIFQYFHKDVEQMNEFINRSAYTRTCNLCRCTMYNSKYETADLKLMPPTEIRAYLSAYYHTQTGERGGVPSSYIPSWHAPRLAHSPSRRHGSESGDCHSRKPSREALRPEPGDPGGERNTMPG